ncbi:MAG: cytidylate kinase [Prochlorococcus sp. SP3034]|nr:cytidylate kinase [Prochlorococcus sp. SP3034]
MTKIIIKTIKELKRWKKSLNKNISFVPTMGNLHKGHLKLIEEANKQNTNTILVSIFINRLQFNNKKDFIKYPKSIRKDIELAFKAGAEAIFIPSDKEIFPKNDNEILYLKAAKELSLTLCGAKRIGHFDGVCTVVYRFITLIKPNIIFLGEKDWQQVLILKRMANDMQLNIKFHSVATVRDFDGVPFSSRNNLLSKAERKMMKLFSQELLNIQKKYEITGQLDNKKIFSKLSKSNISIEYLELVNAYNLQRTDSQNNIDLLAGAITFGEIRLIDHVFLMKRKPIIAIDGPAGSGKSTVTKQIAKKLHLLYLDTGAMYRALSWLIIQQNINYRNKNELKQTLKNISIIFKVKNNFSQDVYINHRCVTEDIRSPEISSIVSSIASISEVRELLVSEQRKIGKEGGLVAEGRDIGTKVFPNAELKIFLTASIDERAKRRLIELKNTGNIQMNFEELKEQIRQRDHNDSNRKISPLKKDKDAIEINTDGFSVDEIVEKIIDLYNEKIPEEVKKFI